MKTALFGSKLKQLAKKLRTCNKIQVPPGYFPVDVVGDAEPKAAVRYVISVEFLKCEFFTGLLDEYHDGETTTGPITLPCSIHKFEEALYRDRLHSRIEKKRNM